jgi:hypothetical protein
LGSVLIKVHFILPFHVEQDLFTLPPRTHLRCAFREPHIRDP